MFVAPGATFVLSGDCDLSPAALSSAFARTRFTSFFPATSSTFLPATLVRFVHGRPCATLRLFAADATFFVAFFNLRCLPFLLRCVFLLASSCNGSPHLKFLDITTNFVRGLDLL